MCVSFAAGMVVIRALLGVARVGLLGLVGVASIDLLNVYVEISEQILLKSLPSGSRPAINSWPMRPAFRMISVTS